jgi:HEAT repeat protein
MLATLRMEVVIVSAVALALFAVIHHVVSAPNRLAWQQPLPYWLNALRSPNRESRDSALDAVEFLAPHDFGTITALLPLLRDDDPLLRSRAATALIEVGKASPRNAPALRYQMLRVLGDRHASVAREQALLVLARGRPERAVVSALIRASTDSDDVVRGTALFALGQMYGLQSGDVFAAELRATRDPVASVRAGAYEALRRSWSGHDALLDAAAVALDDSAVAVREQAIYALSGFGARASRYRVRLTRALEDSASEVRFAARSALERIPPDE